MNPPKTFKELFLIPEDEYMRLKERKDKTNQFDFEVGQVNFNKASTINVKQDARLARQRQLQQPQQQPQPQEQPQEQPQSVGGISGHSIEDQGKVVGQPLFLDSDASLFPREEEEENAWQLDRKATDDQFAAHQQRPPVLAFDAGGPVDLAARVHEPYRTIHTTNIFEQPQQKSHKKPQVREPGLEAQLEGIRDNLGLPVEDTRPPDTPVARRTRARAAIRAKERELLGATTPVEPAAAPPGEELEVGPGAGGPGGPPGPPDPPGPPAPGLATSAAPPPPPDPPADLPPPIPPPDPPLEPPAPPPEPMEEEMEEEDVAQAMQGFTIPKRGRIFKKRGKKKGGKRRERDVPPVARPLDVPAPAQPTAGVPYHPATGSNYTPTYIFNLPPVQPPPNPLQDRMPGPGPRFQPDTPFVLPGPPPGPPMPLALTGPPAQPALPAPPVPPALTGPPVQPALPAPPVPPALTGPPVQPALPAPPVPPALPAPPVPPALTGPPVPPALPAPPVPPALTGPPVPPALPAPPVPPALTGPPVPPALPAPPVPMPLPAPRAPLPLPPPRTPPAIRRVTSSPSRSRIDDFPVTPIRRPPVVTFPDDDDTMQQDAETAEIISPRRLRSDPLNRLRPPTIVELPQRTRRRRTVPAPVPVTEIVPPTRSVSPPARLPPPKPYPAIIPGKKRSLTRDYDYDYGVQLSSKTRQEKLRKAQFSPPSKKKPPPPPPPTPPSAPPPTTPRPYEPPPGFYYRRQKARRAPPRFYDDYRPPPGRAPGLPLNATFTYPEEWAGLPIAKEFEVFRRDYKTKSETLNQDRQKRLREQETAPPPKVPRLGFSPIKIPSPPRVKTPSPPRVKLEYQFEDLSRPAPSNPTPSAGSASRTARRLSNQWREYRNTRPFQGLDTSEEDLFYDAY